MSDGKLHALKSQQSISIGQWFLASISAIPDVNIGNSGRYYRVNIAPTPQNQYDIPDKSKLADIWNHGKLTIIHQSLWIGAELQAKAIVSREGPAIELSPQIESRYTYLVIKINQIPLDCDGLVEKICFMD